MDPLKQKKNTEEMPWINEAGEESDSRLEKHSTHCC